MSRRNAALKAWQTRRHNHLTAMTLEEFRAYEQKQYRKEVQEYFRQARQVIVKLGGVKDADFPNIPVWMRRRSGYRLDVLAAEMQCYGFPVQDGNDVYGLIIGGRQPSRKFA